MNKFKPNINRVNQIDINLSDYKLFDISTRYLKLRYLVNFKF